MVAQRDEAKPELVAPVGPARQIEGHGCDRRIGGGREIADAATEGLEVALVGLVDLVIRHFADCGERLEGDAIGHRRLRGVVDEPVAARKAGETAALAVAELGDAELNRAANVVCVNDSEPGCHERSITGTTDISEAQQSARGSP